MCFFIFVGYILVFFILPILLITALPIIAFINIAVIAVGILLEILCPTGKTVFRVISDICFCRLCFFRAYYLLYVCLEKSVKGIYHYMSFWFILINKRIRV